MRVPESWFAEPVVVSRYAGEGAFGPIFDAEATLLADIDATRQLVRSSSGDEVVSEVTLRLPPRDVDAVSPESTVVVRGRSTRVLAVRPMTVRGAVVFVEVVTT